MALTYRAGLVLIALLLLPAGPAAAQQTWPVLAKMGVGGTWAAACTEDVSDSNWFHTYYGDKSGVGRRRADRGAALSSLNSTIDSSQNLTPTTFLMRIRNDDAGWGGEQSGGVRRDRRNHPARLALALLDANERRQAVHQGWQVHRERQSGEAVPSM